MTPDPHRHANRRGPDSARLRSRHQTFRKKVEMKKTALILTAAALLGTSACTNLDKTTQGALSGGAIGGAVGVAATAIAGTSLVTGALVGGAVGAAAGAYTGCQKEGKCK
jgi:hypothetical protein